MLDLASDAIMGDSAGNTGNTTYYADALHPTATGQNRLAYRYQMALGPLFNGALRSATANTNAIVLTSPTYGTGKFGQGLTGGTSTVPSSVMPLAGLTKPFTIESWASTTATGLSVVAGQTAGSTSRRYFGSDANGNAIASAQTSSGSPLIHDITTTVKVNDGQFHHFALVIDTAETRLYVDGSFAGSTPFTPSATTSAMTVRNYRSSFAWSGVIDEMAIFNGARYTGTGTYTVPSSPYTGSETGLVATYHLDGSGASTP